MRTANTELTPAIMQMAIQKIGLNYLATITEADGTVKRGRITSIGPDSFTMQVNRNAFNPKFATFAYSDVRDITPIQHTLLRIDKIAAYTFTTAAMVCLATVVVGGIIVLVIAIA